MKLTVLIEREKSGLLKAYVIQEGQKGANLLKPGRCSDIQGAKLRIQQRLSEDTGQWVEITWEGVQE